MTTKGLFHKQIIIPIGTNNTERIVIQANKYVKNINRLLQNIKSEIVANYIWSDNKGIIITTNKVVVFSNLNMVEKYIKNLNDVDSSNIISLRLLQSKSYLKILDISYFVENTNLSITFDVIERVIQSNHIFNDLVLALCH